MAPLEIAGIRAWEALDSRGTPTVSCEVALAGGAVGAAVVPAGASTGRHEARELRDGGERYGGLGVRRAVANVIDTLGGAVTGLEASDQAAVDAALRETDGTPDLARLGANAVLAVSVATALAASAGQGEPPWRALAERGELPLMPLPMINVLSGGAHAGTAIDMQDFLAVPVGAASFSEALEWSWRVRVAAADLLRERGLAAALVADEGGLGPALRSNREALELLSTAIERAGFTLGDEVGIAIDVAATQLVQPGGGYRLSVENRTVDARELTAELAGWAAEHPIVSIEDPLGEDDWEGWAEAGASLGHLQLLGDDLFVTNPERLRRGIDSGVGNAVLVKPNQIGTLTSAREVIRMAGQAGYATVLSARSGETEDAWLADLAVAWRTGQIKVGSTMRSERTAKWNRLLRIEAELGDEATFAGRAALAPLRASRG
jgi:enolase